MLPIFRFQIALRGTREIRVHPHQAAEFLALVKAGWRPDARDPLPDGLIVHAPEKGRRRILPEEPFHFGLTLLSPATPSVAKVLHRICSGLERSGSGAVRRGVVFGGNFQLEGIQDLVSGADPRVAGPVPVSLALLAREGEQLAALETLTMRFLDPLRLSRPGGRKGHRCFDPGFFDLELFLRRLAARLADLGLEGAVDSVPSGDLPEVENRLVWVDLEYGGRSRPQFRSGAVGELRFRNPGPAACRLLALGQRVGVGRSVRLGFGGYRMTDLGPDPFWADRAMPLLDAWFRSANVNRHAGAFPPGNLTVRALQARAGSYRPEAPAKVCIRDDRGGERRLAIPRPEDRALQRVVLDELAPALDWFFEVSSVAYRKGLSRRSAARAIRRAIGDGFSWALKADFARFFDHVPHDLLRRRLDAYLDDPAAVGLLMDWVSVGAPATGTGLPTGAPLSPLLANLFLDEFDESIARQGWRLVRYADDFLVLFRDRPESEAVFAEARRLAGELQLSLKESKSRLLDLREPFEFLGFRFTFGNEAPSTTGGPLPVEEFGWRQVERRPEPGPAVRLPGEGAAPGVTLRPTWFAAGSSVTLTAALGLQSDGTQQVVGEGLPGALVLPADACLEGGSIRKALQEGVPLHFLDQAHRHIGSLQPVGGERSTERMIAAIRGAEDEGLRLRFARELVHAKVQNHQALALALADGEGAELLRQAAARTTEATRIDELRGLEGAAARHWFSRFPGYLGAGFRFPGRRYPRARDPVNALINLAHTHLRRMVAAELLEAGFPAAIGFYHVTGRRHAALASDHMEPFLHLAQRSVIELTKRLTPKDFQSGKVEGGSILLRPRARRLALENLGRMLAIPCLADPQGEAVSYRVHLRRQLRSFDSLLSGEGGFRAFRQAP